MHVFAQNNSYNICQSITISPTQVDSTSNQSVTATIALIPQPRYILNNQIQAYLISNDSFGSLNRRQLTIQDNGDTLIITVPSSMIERDEQGSNNSYTISLSASGTALNLYNGSAPCSGTFEPIIPQTKVMGGSCGTFNLEDEQFNRAECQQYADGSWQLNSIYCEVGFDVPPFCEGGVGDSVANEYFPDADFGDPRNTNGLYCLPCVPVNDITPTKNHGETCTVTDECLNTIRGISCRTSVYNPREKKCLYPEQNLSRFRQCIVGENECIAFEDIHNMNTAIDCKGNTSQQNGSIGLCSYIAEISTTGQPRNCTPDTNHFDDIDIGTQYCKTHFGNESFCTPGGFCVEIRSTVNPNPTSTSTPEPTPWELGARFSVEPCTIIRFWANSPGMNIEPGIETAIGCVPSSIQGIFAVVFRIATGIGGGIAFLLILYGGIRMMIARGDPKAIQEAKEILTSAIVGLLLIILSVFILRVLGVDILGIPGFN